MYVSVHTCFIFPAPGMPKNVKKKNPSSLDIEPSPQAIVPAISQERLILKECQHNFADLWDLACSDKFQISICTFGGPSKSNTHSQPREHHPSPWLERVKIHPDGDLLQEITLLFSKMICFKSGHLYSYWKLQWQAAQLFDFSQCILISYLSITDLHISVHCEEDKKENLIHP